MEKDEIFKQSETKPADFKFNEKVATVFDDMVNRSVPFYEEIQRMVAEIATDHALQGTTIYDLGCSTGTTLIQMDKVIERSIKFIGVDDSARMLDKCKLKLVEAGFTRPYELLVTDLVNNLKITNASVVVLCLTLQFIRPIHREKVVNKIIEGIVPGGILIIVEKILAEENHYNRNFIKYYYEMKKRNAYSEMEISQKREALENVLIPYKVSENIIMLKEAGFEHCEIFFKWYNFVGIVAARKHIVLLALSAGFYL